MRVWLVLSTFLVLLLMLASINLYHMAKQTQEYVMATYHVPIQKDELLHRLVSRELTRSIYQQTHSLWLAENTTYSLGYAKEALDWFNGEDVQARDLQENQMGILEAKRALQQPSDYTN